MADELTRDDGRPRARELAIWGVLVLVALVIVGLSLSRLAPAASSRSSTSPPTSALPPVLGEVPDFSLTNRDGRTIRRADLAGAPWIADFIFTRCAGICPRLSARLREVLASRPGDRPLRAASISVDPEHDTPEVLAAYAARFEAPESWLFLTGPRDQIHTLTRDGFKLAVGGAAPDKEILHSDRIVLVDGAGRIRGYYDSFDDDAIARLYADLAALGG